MSFIKVYIHYVWATKNRYPFLSKDIRQNVFEHIRENAKNKNIYIDFINGYSDHIHCLISMNDEHSIGDIARLIKGESSYWINKNKICNDKFAWQNEYFAMGISDKDLARVRNYIANQESHHSGNTFQQEYDKFIERYGFEAIRKDLD